VARVFDARRSEDVYDLTIDGPPEFYADGVLVHNCMDALRYMTVGVALMNGTSWADAMSDADLETVDDPDGADAEPTPRPKKSDRYKLIEPAKDEGEDPDAAERLRKHKKLDNPHWWS
jgi:hypothetical protein